MARTCFPSGHFRCVDVFYKMVYFYLGFRLREDFEKILISKDLATERC